jgi:chemotaxis protein CheX
MTIDADILLAAQQTQEGMVDSLSDIVRQVFSTMVMMEVTGGTPLREPVISFRDTVTSMVGFAGGYVGCLSIHSPNQLALQVASNMLGMEIDEVNEDVADAMGEIANMVGGDVKHIFAPSGSGLSISVPSVVHGSEYVVESISGAESMTLEFDCEGNRFLLALKIGK